MFWRCARERSRVGAGRFGERAGHNDGSGCRFSTLNGVNSFWTVVYAICAHVGMPLLGVAQKLVRPRPNSIWACFGVGPQDANQGTPKTWFLALENNIWAG